MIVISSNLVLGEIEGVPPNAPRIGYRSLLTRDVVADSEQLFFPASNLANGSTNLVWRSESIDQQHLLIAAGLNEGVDYIGVANHNWGSGGIAYRVEGSDNGADWEPISDEIIPSGDEPHMQLFGLAVYAFYRIRLTPTEVPPMAAVIYLGRVLGMQRSLYVGHTPITLGRKTTVSSNKSERGQFLGRIIRREYLECSAQFENLTPSWYRLNFDPFVEAARTQPFFWAWRPVDYPLEVGYCWTTSDITPTNQRNNGMMQVDMKIQGIGRYLVTPSDGSIGTAT